MVVSKPARTALRDWLVSGITPAAPGPLEAQALLEEAGRQGLVGLLAAAPAFLKTLPQDVGDDWRRGAHQLLARGVHQLDLAGRVLRRLEAAGHRSLPLKGAAVAERLYASVAERPMADVDVLVLDDAGGASRLLEGEGFAVVERAEHAVALREARTGGILELHRCLTACPGLFPLDRDGLFTRRVSLAGAVPFAPAPSDLLVSLSLHAAFQHGFGLSLVQYLDLKRLLERESLLEAAVLDAAETAGACGAVLLSLAASRAVVGADPPAALLRALEGRVPRALRRRARTLEEGEPLRLVAPAHPPLGVARWALAHGRRRALLRHTLRPEAWPGEPRPRLARSLLVGFQRASRLLRREASQALSGEAIAESKLP